MKFFLSVVCIVFFLGNANAQKTDSVYALVINFGSKCCGVPAAEPVFASIQSFKRMYKLKKIYCDKIGPLGREGEYQLAFSLAMFTGKQKLLFISKIKTTVAKCNDAVKDNASAGYMNVEENVLKENYASGGRTKVVKMLL